MKKLKLWQQIFFYSLSMIMLAIDLVAALLLLRSHQLLVQQEHTRGITEHQTFSVNLLNNVLYERLRQNRFFLPEETVFELLDKQVETVTEEGKGVLISRETLTVASRSPQAVEVSRRSGVAAPELEKGSYQLQIVDVGEQSHLVVHSKISVEGSDYDLFTSTDISHIYRFRDQQMRFVQVVSVLCACVIAGILLIILLWLLAPLRNINDTTRQIAKGNYDIRLQEQGSLELVELCRNMNRMADAVEHNVDSLRKVAQDRKDFIANLAHEMKTPLTSILGFSDLLRIQRTVPDEQRQEYAGIIVEEAKRLRTLSGKLMELITVGHTQVEKIPQSIPRLFHEVQTVLLPALEKNGIVLQTEPLDVTVLADPELLKSLLYNLIDNAAKASPSGGVVRLLAVAPEPGRVKITVQDFGIGMPQSELRKVVQPFYMLDKSRTRKHGGAGLGLALCVEIVRLHKSEMHIESEPGKGTQVSFEMEVQIP